MFEAGDRVQYIGDFSRQLVGKLGTIRIGTNSSYGDVYVRWDDNTAEPEGVLPHNIIKISDPLPQEKILDIAKGLVYGDRGASYGHPADDYARTAMMWSAILGTEVTTVQAIQCMIAVKLSRLCNTPDHRDSWVDVAGYAECGDRVVRYNAGELDS